MVQVYKSQRLAEKTPTTYPKGKFLIPLVLSEGVVAGFILWKVNLLSTVHKTKQNSGFEVLLPLYSHNCGDDTEIFAVL